MPLPGMEEYVLSFPNYYVTGIFISLIIGLVFLSYFGIRFAGETKKRSEALSKLQQILAKEYELESLGGQAAAAAHSLGTPLATISVVSKELRKEIGWGRDDSDDYNKRVKETAMMLKYESSRKILKELEEYMNSDECSIMRQDKEEKIVINY